MNARAEFARLSPLPLAAMDTERFADHPVDPSEQEAFGPCRTEPAVLLLPPEEGVEPKKKKADKAKKKAKIKLADDSAGAVGAAEAKPGKSKQAGEFGSARGVETVFRSSYRTQLDLTALAATKANIMISLNGFILSVLTLSGPFVLVAEPMFTVPIAIFLTTCLASIIFAVLAARPRLFQRKHTPEDFAADRANVLVGGSQDSFALQPVSVSGETGVNVAVGLSRITLNPM